MAGGHLKTTILHQQTFTARHITTSCHVTPDQVTSHHVRKDNNQVQQGKNDVFVSSQFYWPYNYGSSLLVV